MNHDYRRLTMLLADRGRSDLLTLVGLADPELVPERWARAVLDILVNKLIRTIRMNSRSLCASDRDSLTLRTSRVIDFRRDANMMRSLSDGLTDVGWETDDDAFIECGLVAMKLSVVMKRSGSLTGLVGAGLATSMIILYAEGHEPSSDDRAEFAAALR